jgi:hypothetical protein
MNTTATPITNSSAAAHLSSAIYEMAELFNGHINADDFKDDNQKLVSYGAIVSTCKAHEALCDFDEHRPIEVKISTDGKHIEILSVDIY